MLVRKPTRRAKILILSSAIIIAAAILTLAGCATQPTSIGDYPGIFLGFVHGLIVPVTLVGSIFYDIRIYAFPNSGVLYDFGFVLGYSISGTVMFLSTIARIGGLLATGRL